jgi:hypothetical protein
MARGGTVGDVAHRHPASLGDSDSISHSHRNPDGNPSGDEDAHTVAYTHGDS